MDGCARRMKNNSNITREQPVQNLHQSLIRYLTVQKDEGLPHLVQLAKYLRIIGTQNGKYKNLRQQKALYSGTRPPDCVYWTW
jgi:hypothetical protein